MGDFLAFQLLIDLNYSNLTDFSEMDFVVAGPGARDGIRKCSGDDHAGSRRRSSATWATPRTRTSPGLACDSAGFAVAVSSSSTVRTCSVRSTSTLA